MEVALRVGSFSHYDRDLRRSAAKRWIPLTTPAHMHFVTKRSFAQHSQILGGLTAFATAVTVSARKQGRHTHHRRWALCTERRAILELWLDCRNSVEHCAVPTHHSCDRKLHDAQSACERGVEDLGCEQDSGRLVDGNGNVAGVICVGNAAKAQVHALAAIGSADWVVLEATDGAVCVPAENLIAAGRQSGTRIAVVASCVKDVAGLAGALQLGVDALVLPRADAQDDAEAMWNAAAEAKQQRKTDIEQVGQPAVDDDSVATLSIAKVTAVESVAGLGDRVCLDLIQLMVEGEGALVGSTAKGLSFLQAETAMTGLVPPRPFRINAGPVHAYIALKDGRTKYLSEVEAGDELLIVHARAAAKTVEITSRAITVGRCKIEPRPMLCVRFCDGDRKGQMFLQQAETVRLLARSANDTTWAPCSVTSLCADMEILVRWADKGTHVGRRIAAVVDEK